MREIEPYLEKTLLLADRLEQRKKDLQEAAAMDAGFPARVTGTEVDMAVRHLRTMSEEASWVANGQPFGTVAAIFPYDAPAIMLGRLGGSAIITGNRLRFSFSSLIPRSARIISEICGPVDALQPVTNMNNREFGKMCVEDPEVRVLFMSGGSGVGEAYLRQKEAFSKVFFAGPGGMPAVIVFEDADLELASSFIAGRAFLNGGQYCTTAKKALIHSSIYEEMRKRILEKTSRIRVGDPLDPNTDMGPILVERTRKIVAHAVETFSEARLLTGRIDGETIHPFVLEAESTWPVPDSELFGPFLLLKPFDDPDAAVKELTQTRYGFLLSIFGKVSGQALELFHQNFGMVLDNPVFLFYPLRKSFGGKKESGWIIERSDNGWICRDGAFYYSRELVRQQ